ncbi:23S rRNA (uracil1939-C5)-methyltransferase [Clostridium acidisoli DSM 12555]|uniref:23S rRNA (Uracil1939-C5)-methyltransferase n=1 Tax=Clostridium acidisoli DSM 12555 TaxID=1121291 RepID=A0A1W1XIK2_9CLOT|nr:23S rRNA (uracil(1939)-C(5))-methyltransferase RlmD [Clostridium acidisoli]SMC23341.1 23S rRNA (uracil1939-C5)-methyltransferase [Clostridium acidisoli DSM 12555]
MKKNIPVEKNEVYTINIEALGYEGEGIGKIDDFTIFVKGAIDGETVEAKIIKVNKNFAFGKLTNIIKKSPDRVEPICEIYNKCGGCSLQHLSYGKQLQFKKKRVEDCLERIGKLKVNDENGIKINETIGMETPYRYRNKVQLPVGNKNGEVVVGFYSARSHEIVSMEKCYIQHEVGDKIVSLIKDWIKDNKISLYDENNGQGIIRHVMVRKAFKTGDVMVVIVANSNKLPHKEELIKLLQENINELKSIVLNVNKKRTNVILGDKCETIFGEDTIVDSIGKFKFNISPLSFFQVNPVQTEKLYEKALEYAALNGDEIVFDAYCGAGTISLFLSQKAKKVYGVEIIKEAIDDAKKNAIENNVKNVEFIVGQSEKVIPELINKGIMADVVVVDPPRKGCEKSLLEEIANMKPQKIVYVSCDPGTLARDLLILTDLEYKVVEVQPVDMFSQTSHVETCSLLVRKRA